MGLQSTERCLFGMTVVHRADYFCLCCIFIRFRICLHVTPPKEEQHIRSYDRVHRAVRRNNDSRTLSRGQRIVACSRVCHLISFVRDPLQRDQRYVLESCTAVRSLSTTGKPAFGVQRHTPLLQRKPKGYYIML